MKKNVLTGVLSAAMVLSMAVPTFAAPITAGEIAGADTVGVDGIGTYNFYEGVDLVNNETGEATPDGNIDAGKASSIVVLDAEATTFKVTVPIALHVHQAADGSHKYADSMEAANGTTVDGTGTAKIINECVLGQVKIEDVKLVAATDYTISAWDADYKNMKVNSKTFGFKLNGLEANTDGSLARFAVAEDTIASTVVNEADGKTDIERVFTDYEFTRSGDSKFPVINNGCVLPITYEAKLPAYSRAIDAAKIGGVVFTVNFN